MVVQNRIYVGVLNGIQRVAGMQRQGLESTYLSICNELNKVLKLWRTDNPLLLHRCGYSQLIFKIKWKQ